MANNLGSGVSRVLNPDGTEYVEVIWQQGKPPMDAELNLLQELGVNYTRKALLRGTPSGFLGNDTNTSAVFSTNSIWSNWFQFGKQRAGEQKAVLWAVVNGWLLPITGTRTGTPPGAPDDSDTWNKIALDPPPSNAGDFRIDFVFLEVWLARIPPNPSTLNKPSASAIYRYGNVEGGFSYLPDDLIDPALGFETTQRVQLQYRIRVAKGLVGFTSYPDGFDPVVVKAQGAAASPTSWTFQNMREALGDPGLWRAGDGTANTLGTVDGYVYAVPIAAVFRRNGVVWSGDPAQNLNGGFNRNPTAVDRTGVATFSTAPVLAADLNASALSLTLTSAINIPLPLSPLNPVTIQIGDELLQYQSINYSSGVMTLVARGVNGSRAEAHKAGTPVQVVSGRPDGLFSDQVALTDILDLRHVVSPNGFNYQTLLEENLDKLLRGQLRSNWKRSGAGPQGAFVFYEDKITNGSVATGVTKLDGPDNIRQIFSDASVLQRVELIVAPATGTPPVAIEESWSLSLSVLQTAKVLPGTFFQAGDVLSVPVAQLKGGLPGGDTDQVRWVYDGDPNTIQIRIDGQTNPVDPSTYTVTPTNPGPSDDLVITLGASFPTTNRRLYITAHVLYGPGRGLSRRPDSFHSVVAAFPSGDLLLNQQTVATDSFKMRVKPLYRWAKYTSQPDFEGMPPVTAEAYAELGSKTLVLQPLRRIDLPDTVVTMDGTAANLRPTVFATGTGSTTGSVLQDPSQDFVAAGVVAGDALVLTSGAQPGRYTVLSISTTTNPNDTLNLERAVPTGVGVSYEVYKAQGLMPLLKRDGVTAKWTTTDPMSLFSGTTEVAAATKNIYVTFPRNLIPGWGEYNLPLLWQDESPFSQGINYLLNVVSGASPFPNSQANYCPFSNGAFTYTSFATVDLGTFPYTNPATYNTKVPAPGKDYAGIRKYTDTRGLGRQGLQFPPFYGLARVWAVYEAQDYRLNGSAFSASDRTPTGSASAAKNLLRQNVPEPLFWIETDDDGDSTFILNAACLDLSKSTLNPLANFAAGEYVVEASIYGFDRDSFDVNREFRMVLSRQRAEAVAGVRATNIATTIDAPELIVPATFTGSDQVLVNYSRTPYQGDAFGSQTLYQDIGYTPGPLQSGEVYALTANPIDQSALTRPNQKVLEVLAETSFTTTLGTGRLLLEFNGLNPGNVGFEDRQTAWPPTSPVAPRPLSKLGALLGTPNDAMGSAYQGCTERLPLGALFRDKDFRGNFFVQGYASGITFHKQTFRNVTLGSQPTPTYEQTEVPLNLVDSSAGRPSDFIVHVDGNQGNWSLLTNFRVNRGGSLFSANQSSPGGDVTAMYPKQLLTPPGADDTRVTVLVGRAMLVRNSVTTTGVGEVSAGNEIMMVIQTTAKFVKSAVNPESWFTAISTNGLLEGNSAADLYRIEGRPIVNDFRRVTIDPSSIPLTRRTFTYIP